MSLTREQRISLELAGTVPIPSPFPALGEIRLVSDVEPGEKVSAADIVARKRIFLEIGHRISPKLKITRILHLGDVAAVFLPDDPDAGCRHDRGTWILSTQLQLESLGRIESRGTKQGRDDPIRLGRGVAYVPESAPVLMQVEVAMTAAECVEYYPPLPGELGSDPIKSCNLD